MHLLKEITEVKQFPPDPGDRAMILFEYRYFPLLFPSLPPIKATLSLKKKKKKTTPISLRGQGPSKDWGTFPLSNHRKVEG